MNNVLGFIGSQGGDEGKGAVVLEYLKNADACVRTAGGNNAGHTLYDSEGNRRVVNIAPSGVILPGMINIIANGCVLDLGVLDQNMQGAEGKLYISDAAHLIFDYHRHLDGIQESSKGNKKIGTTKKGIGPAYADKINRVGIRAGLLKNPERLEEVLREMISIKDTEMMLRGYDCQINKDKLVEEMKPLFEKYAPLVRNTTELLHHLVDSKHRIALEGAQGTMLDIDHGTYPYVTSSNTTIGGMITGTGLSHKNIDGVVGIVKSYTTRVGEGPCPTEGEPGEFINRIKKEEERSAKEVYMELCGLTEKEKRIVQAGDVDHPEYDKLVSRYIREDAEEFGSTTGRPRRTGWLDAAQLRKAARINGLDWLAITRLDNLDGIGKLKICVGYESEFPGDIIGSFPNDVSELESRKPVYEVMDGWKSTKGIRSFNDLPTTAKEYLSRISELVGVQICKIKNGPKQQDYIELANPWLKY